MLPKVFLVNDLHIQLAHTLADLQALRRRMDATERTIAAQRKRIDALRKRIERSARARNKMRCDHNAGQQHSESPLDH